MLSALPGAVDFLGVVAFGAPGLLLPPSAPFSALWEVLLDVMLRETTPLELPRVSFIKGAWLRKLRLDAGLDRVGARRALARHLGYALRYAGDLYYPQVLLREHWVSQNWHRNSEDVGKLVVRTF